MIRFLITFSALCSPALALQGEVISLGAMAPGASSLARAVNADGTVVVGQGINAADEVVAFRWTAATGMVDLGDLPGGSVRSDALGVSANGSVVVGIGVSGQGFEAFRWTPAGGMVGLGDLPGGSFHSEAYAVSADGSTVVGYSSSSLGPEAFVWTAATGMVGLGQLSMGNDPSSTANAVSADGSVVVGGSHSGGGIEAFRWTAADGMLGLGFLPGPTFFSKAIAVSADGSIVVGNSGGEVFRWTSAGGMVGLGAPPPGALSVTATGVDASGATIVGFGDVPPPNGSSFPELRALLWNDQVPGGVILQEHLAAGGATGLQSWLLTLAHGVSADGNSIVGVGFESGVVHAWLARLAPAGPGDITDSYCDPAAPNSTGQPASISATGSPLAILNYVVLRASELPPNQFGYFLNSRVDGFVATPPGSQGNLCLGGAIGRYVADVRHSGPGGEFELTLDLPNTPTAMGSTSVLAGDTRYFQAWYRDMNPAATSNFTNGLRIAFQ